MRRALLLFPSGNIPMVSLNCFSGNMCKMRHNTRRYSLVILALTVLIVCSLWRFREGFDVKEDCIRDELEQGKYMSDLQLFTNYGDHTKIEQCKEFAKGEMYSRWEEVDDKNKYSTCEHYSEDWYDKNKRIIQKECGERFLAQPKKEEEKAPVSTEPVPAEPVSAATEGVLPAVI